jgi:hypothetical protein
VAGLVLVAVPPFDDDKTRFNRGYGAAMLECNFAHSRQSRFPLPDIGLFHAPVVTTIIPSILIRKAIVGSYDNGANSTARLNAAISIGTAGLAASVAPSAQIGIPSDVSALRSVRRSASRLIFVRLCRSRRF